MFLEYSSYIKQTLSDNPNMSYDTFRMKTQQDQEFGLTFGEYCAFRYAQQYAQQNNLTLDRVLIFMLFEREPTPEPILETKTDIPLQPCCGGGEIL